MNELLGFQIVLYGSKDHKLAFEILFVSRRVSWEEGGEGKDIFVDKSKIQVLATALLANGFNRTLVDLP